VFLRPVGEAIRKRREYIDSVKGDYDRYRYQVTHLTQEADDKRAAARREAAALVQESRAKAESEAAAIAADYAGRSGKLVDEAHATIDGELAEARGREPKLAGELAKQLLERAVGAKP
jgi:F0F1-type ATP synthase membrane subunit b/b'